MINSVEKSLSMSNNNVLSVEDDAEVVEHTGSIIWNYYKVDGAQSKVPRI